MMPLIEILFWSFVVYYLFRFVFNFLLPVARATRHVRQQFRNMQDPMGGGRADQTGPNGGGAGQGPGQSSSGKAPAGDYIDFEEIK